MRKPGDAVPAFSLPASDGRTVSAAGLRGQRYVLYFYPKDDTPGCTKEACAFRDNLPAFGGLGVPVFGVSADNEASHRKFVAKYGLNFPLLADPDRKLIEPIGAWVEKSMYGRSYMGIARCTFIVGTDGRIERVWEKVSPEGHAAEVLAALGGAATAAPKVAAASRATKAAAKPAATKPVIAKAPAQPKAAKPAATKAAAKPKSAKAAPAKKAGKPAGAKKAAKPGAKAKPSPKQAARKAPAKKARRG
jgi:peroxiredoxin Q/BCP